MKKRHNLTDADVLKIYQLTEDGIQQRKIAQEIGVCEATIGRICKRLGFETQRSGPRSAEEHPGWKGGRVKNKGYWYVYCPGHPHTKKGTHYVAEHRLVMEQKLGRYLLPSEVVHHIDANPENNDPANLIVFGSNALHLKHELTGRCPDWTPEGRERTLAAKRKYSGTKKERARQAWLSYEKNHPNRRRDARQPLPGSAHPPE